MRRALIFLKKYVFGTPRQDEDDEDSSSEEDNSVAGIGLVQALDAEGITIDGEAHAKTIVNGLQARVR